MHPYIQNLWSLLTLDEELYFSHYQQGESHVINSMPMAVLDDDGNVVPCSFIDVLIWHMKTKTKFILRDYVSPFEIVTIFINQSRTSTFFQTTCSGGNLDNAYLQSSTLEEAKLNHQTMCATATDYLNKMREVRANETQ